jgi:CDP-L-myo-inositol myo-inositolphosphotransferase
MIDQAVVLAPARERSDATGAALRRVAGLSLLERSLLTLARAGVRRAIVVGGDEVRRAVDDTRAGLAVEVVALPAAEGDGAALLAAAGRLAGPFLVVRAAQVHEPALVARAAAAETGSADVHLCVDARRDAEGALRVRTEGERVVDAGETLPGHDAVACGVLAASPALLAAIEEEPGAASLAGALGRLARRGRVRALPCGDLFWLAVESPAAQAHAEGELFRQLRKRVDGPVARLVNRPISLAVTRRIVDTGITPNQMSVVAGAIGLAGVALVFAAASWPALIAGALLLQAQSILDGCDGELARLKLQQSKLGEWLDNVTDDVLNILYCAALGAAAARFTGAPWLLWAGLAGALGFTIYCVVLYHQLATVHRSGNPFLFRWWFQREGEDLKAALERPGLVPAISASFRAIGRRDAFLLLFVVLCAARLPQIAAVWYAVVGVANGAVSAVHTAMRLRAPARAASHATTRS